MIRFVCLIAALVFSVWTTSIWATQDKNYDMYRADYAKGAFCSAIAGACASDNNPENGFFQNPAALVAGPPDFLFDGDYNPSDNIEPGMKTGNSINETTYMAGAAHAGEGWAFGLAASAISSDVKATSTLYDDAGNPYNIGTSDSNFTLFLNLPIAYKISPQWTVGAALVAMYYTEKISVDNGAQGTTTSLDKFPKFGFSFGTLFTLNNYFRFGSWLRTPISFSVEQQLDTTILGQGISFDDRVHLMYPFIWANGVSFMPWGDPKTILLDIDFIGTTYLGHERTLDTFQSATDDRVLRPKGRTMAVEPHLAWRSPWSSGSSGTYSLGTYYENGRWGGIDGRLHGVTGVAYKFNIFEGLIAFDIAKDFFSFQLSFR